METKFCIKCEKTKPLSEFYVYNGKAKTYCRPCHIAYIKIYQSKHKGSVITMEESTTQLIRKGICLVLWRCGRGRIGERVKLSLSELRELLNAIGVLAHPPTIQTAIASNVKSSWVERKIVSTYKDEISEYRLSSLTGQRAQECATELGTELLPVLPKVVNEGLVEDVMAVFGGRILEDPVVIEPDTDDGNAAFIEQLLTTLTKAADYDALTGRLKVAEARASGPDAIVLTTAIMLLQRLSALDKSPLGMLINKEYEAAGALPMRFAGPTTLAAGLVAEALTESGKK